MFKKILYLTLHLPTTIKFLITNYRFKKCGYRKFKFDLYNAYEDNAPFYSVVIKSDSSRFESVTEQENAYTILAIDHEEAFLCGSFIRIKEVI